MKPASFPDEILQLRIQVREIEPPIYRVVQVSTTRTFHLLHEIIQWSFAWRHAHLYQFYVGSAEVTEPNDELPKSPRPLHPRTTRLGDLVSKNVRQFEYVYDLGDCWFHDILIEKRLAPDPAVRTPVCLEGARAGPPEDSGGPPGFDEFLETWRDPDHEDNGRMVEWAGPRYDPERFDLKLTNDILKSLWPQRAKGGR